jgi:HEAT repeat protein
VSGGLETTWRILAATRNETAVDALLAALDSPREEIVMGALRALLERRTPRGLTELVRRWDRFPAAWKETIAAETDRLSGALRDALVQKEEPALCANACHAAVWLHEYDLSSILIHIAESPEHKPAQLAASTLLRLAELLHEELTSARGRAQRRDPLVVRTRVVAALEKSIQRWMHHQRPEILEAFLVLAPRDNPTLRQILNNPHHAAYLKVLEALANSKQPGVIRLVIGFLDDRRAPTAALQTLARRCDEEFLSRLIKKIGYEPSAAARRNLKLIRDFPWLRSDSAQIDALDDAGQHALVQMITASSMKRSEALALLERLLKQGQRGGRRAAAESLRHFQGAEANQLVLDALKDGDPLVQAAALTHVRQRALPGAMARLLELLESDHETVRSAARKCLTDFTCARFLAAFDMLTAEARHTTGKLVGRIDPNAATVLSEELSSPARNRRMRALDAAAAIGVAPALEEPLLEMLKDGDHLLRAKAAEVLRYCDTPRVRQALREHLLDPNAVVQLAAEESLAHFTHGDTVPAGATSAETAEWEAALATFPLLDPRD